MHKDIQTNNIERPIIDCRRNYNRPTCEFFQIKQETLPNLLTSRLGDSNGYRWANRGYRQIGWWYSTFPAEILKSGRAKIRTWDLVVISDAL